MAGEVKHRDLKDHLPCTYQIQHFFKKKIFLGVKKTLHFQVQSSWQVITTWKKIYSEVSRWQLWESDLL